MNLMGTEMLIIFGKGDMSRRLATLAEQIGRLPGSIAFLSDQIGGEEEIDGIRVIQRSLDSAKEIADNAPWSRPLFINGMGHDQKGYRGVPDVIKKAGLPLTAYTSLIHPTAKDLMARTAYVSPYGVAIFANTSLGPGVKVGRHSFANGDWGTDAYFGAFGTAAPGVIVEGESKVGKDVYLGAGSKVLKGSIIGRGALVEGGVTVSGKIWPKDKAVMDPVRVARQ